PFFDRIELPGGKLVTILQIDIDPMDSTKVRVRFDLREPSDSSSTLIYPRGARRELSPQQSVKYRIHRSPIRSNTAPLTLPKGIAIDFNYSGVGLTGSQFSNAAGTNNIAVIFGPDGRVSRYIDSAGRQHIPAGQLFFCLGDLAGVRPDDIYANAGRDRANINREKSTWIVINNQTGRTFTAPMTSVSGGTLTIAASAAKLAQTLREARFLASLSDKVEGF
ncbi:MAG TPA: protein containing Prepilin-type cleavage/methylation, partial [Planctomycetaceae bacterium]|nr:protein containing Prepilin-type cleavage/methylation [Planctomycetaceae bacterium]